MPECPAADPARPWRWVPSLYLTQGLPFVAINSIPVILYKDLGVDNARIAFYTSWLYLPWVIKPLWSPLVETGAPKRTWIWALQGACAVGLGGVALTLPLPGFFQVSLLLFWLAAFASATHDIAADGFYITALSERRQAFFVGVRSTFFRLANILGQGGLVMAVGWLMRRGWGVAAWQAGYGLLAVGLAALTAWHALVLPRPSADRPAPSAGSGRGAWWRTWGDSFRTFFARPGLGPFLAFLLLYRLGEAQLTRLVAPFLKDPRERGGLGLDTWEVGRIYGLLGVGALLTGGILGGWAASRRGLRAWLWPMVLAMNLPNLLYVYLAVAQPQAVSVVAACVVVEQFGYGFGFCAMMLLMLRLAQGPQPAAHYAICTAFMALGMMAPGLWSGWLQEQLGYPWFFLWATLATLPGILLARRLPLDA